MARWRGGGVSPLLWHNIFEVTKTELKTLLCCYPTSFRYDGGGVGGARDDLDAGDRGCEGQEAEQEPRQPRHRERHHDWPRRLAGLSIMWPPTHFFSGVQRAPRHTAVMAPLQHTATVTSCCAVVKGYNHFVITFTALVSPLTRRATVTATCSGHAFYSHRSVTLTLTLAELLHFSIDTVMKMQYLDKVPSSAFSFLKEEA